MYILIYDETVSNVILCQLKHGLDYFLHSVELIFKLRTVTNIYPSFSLLFQLKIHFPLILRSMNRSQLGRFYLKERISRKVYLVVQVICIV